MTNSLADLPTTRVRNARTGKWVELPDSIPGFAYHHAHENGKGTVKLFPIADIEAFHKSTMSRHDSLPPAKRWESNYIGANKLRRPLPTDPPQWGRLSSPLSADDLGL